MGAGVFNKSMGLEKSSPISLLHVVRMLSKQIVELGLTGQHAQ